MRFRTKGAREYLRFTEDKYPNTDMWGDCGAFTYVKDDVPPYTVDDIIDFYGDVNLHTDVQLTTSFFNSLTKV